MKRFGRVFWIVLDSVGIGAMPDAPQYGDSGSDTLGNIARFRRLNLPNLRALGLANIRALAGMEPALTPLAAYGRCALASPGKDTTTGHWEMAGIILAKAFPLYPNGFPAGLIAEFERRIGRKTLGNYAASGTEIIKQLGPEHMRTGAPIVYTSADSVFQIAAHEDVIPIAEQYRICEIARAMLTGEHEVGRVIARPFIGVPGAFVRTANRHDYAVAPPEGMLLDRLSQANVPVLAIGKISDIFLGRGIARSEKTKSNEEGRARTLHAAQTSGDGVVFVNLVDFDMLYGHRNDVEGYAQALEAVDNWLPSLMAAMQKGDLLILCADHGNDPTTASTDHDREYVPLLVYGGIPVDLGTRQSLADIGQTVAANFGCSITHGTSFLPDISRAGRRTRKS
jgi:phosphopentomutase